MLRLFVVRRFHFRHILLLFLFLLPFFLLFILLLFFLLLLLFFLLFLFLLLLFFLLFLLFAQSRGSGALFSRGDRDFFEARLAGSASTSLFSCFFFSSFCLFSSNFSAFLSDSDLTKEKIRIG